MSDQITRAFVEQYKANVFHLTQQKGSKLRRAVQIETLKGKKGYVDQLGSTAARKRTSRHSDTPRMDTPHARRSKPSILTRWRSSSPRSTSAASASAPARRVTTRATVTRRPRSSSTKMVRAARRS